MSEDARSVEEWAGEQVRRVRSEMERSVACEAMLERLGEITARRKALPAGTGAKTQEAALLEMRDVLIRSIYDLFEDTGRRVPRKRIADAAGLTLARVGQVRHGHRGHREEP